MRRCRDKINKLARYLERRCHRTNKHDWNTDVVDGIGKEGSFAVSYRLSLRDPYKANKAWKLADCIKKNKK